MWTLDSNAQLILSVLCLTLSDDEQKGSGTRNGRPKASGVQGRRIRAALVAMVACQSSM